MTLLLEEAMFKQTCRTCLTTNGEMVSIFSPGFYVDHLPKKLMSFTKVEISNDDPLPKVICKTCMFMADSFYCFKEQCESVDNQLKLLLRRNLEIVKTNDSSNEKNARNKVTSMINNSAPDPASLKPRNSHSVFKNLRVDDEVNDHVNVEIEYISEEVRINVENALKRRREAEQRISMEKVSKTVKNLKGIEVVPISNVAVDSSFKNAETKKEEIVVYPVASRKSKKYNNMGTFVVNDSSTPLSEKLRLPPEITVSKINGDNSSNEDHMVYGKHKKLHFSTVRKIVKIDDRRGCSDLKEENIDKDWTTENPSMIKNDQDDVVVIVSDDSECENPTYCKTGSNESSGKQDLDILGHELIQINPKNVNQLSETSIQSINTIAADIQIDNKIMTEDVNTLTGQEKEDWKTPEIATDFNNCHSNRESTIDSPITAIDHQYVRCVNRTGKAPYASSLKMNSKNRRDRSKGVFVENNAKKIITDEATESLYLRTKSYFKSRKTNDKLLLNLKNTNNQGTSLADERTSNLNVDQRINSESVHNNTSPNLDLTFYQCTICSVNFESLPKVLKHNIQEHMLNKLNYDCLVCDKSYKDKTLLCAHVEEHNSVKPFQCTFCPKAFWLKRSLRKHVNDHINFASHQCNICMKKFSGIDSLKSHSVLHTGNSPFACRSCNVTFNSKTNWKRHVLTVHENSSLLLCKFCNKKLPNRRSLRIHTRVHTGEKPFQCPHCDKRFTQQSNLNTHIHCHLNDRPFTCPHCGKGFNRRGTRDDHVLTHTGVKRHKCTVCDASFAVPSALKRHLWIHTDKARPYSCDKCKLRFIGFCNLRKHLKARHGQFIELKYPRVVRVVVQNDQNKEDQGSRNNLTESGPQDNVQAFDTVEITTLENDFSSPNVNKLEDLQTVNTETKVEGFEA